MKTPSESDRLKAAKWLLAAQRELRMNEYHKVKLLCGQVRRILRRKNDEHI